MGKFPELDIVIRLRDVKRRGQICAEAADEIERLRDYIEQLRSDITYYSEQLKSS